MRTPRWLVAVMVTVAAFAMTTWICGALILPVVMRDPGVRWGVAGACGVAVAALAALWGHSFASAGRSEDTRPRECPASYICGNSSQDWGTHATGSAAVRSTDRWFKAVMYP